jgi:hypothetical protein
MASPFTATRFYFTMTRMVFHTDILSLCSSENDWTGLRGHGASLIYKMIYLATAGPLNV